MEDFISQVQTYHLTYVQWILIFLCGVFIGVSKAGINSISIITVSVLAWCFGSKVSTGILLPMLIFADLLAVMHYRRLAKWHYLIKLMPWVVAGVIVAAVTGHSIDAFIFKKIMAIVILISMVLILWWEYKPALHVPHRAWFAGLMGLATGFTSMIGNLAGGVSNIYFLSMRLEKKSFIGTVAWLFLLLNLVKLPFHIFSWHTISTPSLYINLILLPFVFLGFWIGIHLVRQLEEARFRNVILWLTVISSLAILLGQ